MVKEGAMPDESDKHLESEAEEHASLNDVWKRWTETDPSFCYAFHQQSFDLFCALNARHVAQTLLEQLPHLRDSPYQRVSDIIQALSGTAEMQGALLFAVLTRKPYLAPEVDHEISLETLLKSHTVLQEDDSEVSKTYQAATAQLDLLDDLFPSAAMALSTHVVQQFHELKSYEDQINEIVTNLVLDGIKTEFLFTRLVNAGDATKYLLKKMFSELTDKQNPEDQ
jgi:hypothetical protein